MLSFASGQTLFGTLSLNSSASNLALYGQLANFEHRYLLQQYFENEGSYTIQTIGSTSLTLTAAPAINAVSATLAVAWQYPTSTTTVTFSDGEVRNVNFINGSTVITWSVGLVGASFALTAQPAAGATSATLSTAWSTATQTTLSSFSDGTTKTITYTLNSSTISWAGGLTEAQLATVNTSTASTTISVGGVQFYPLPPNYSKLKTITITTGILKWTLNEVRSRVDWDEQNKFPYYSAIPQNYFVYPGGDYRGAVGIWPIPSTTGNIITYNYKYRVPDLSLADYTTPGTVSVTNGTTAVTGSGTSWTVSPNVQLESRWIQFAPTSSSSTTGDNLWYQVKSVDSATGLTLYQPYQGTTITSSASYTLGQMPLLAEDFQDMLLWSSLKTYFTTIVDNPKKAEEFGAMYEQKLKALEIYSGTNTIQVNLSRKPMGRNPNLFQNNLS